MKYNPFSFLVEKFLAEELSKADAVEALAKDEAVIKAASAPFHTVVQRNAIYQATVKAGAKRAADMRAGAVAMAKMRAAEMMPAAAAGAGGTTHSGRRRGPKPVQSPRVIAAMQADLANGFDLDTATEEEMSSKYDASRDVCRHAKNEVLSVEK
jgi:hypothetical protein